MTQPEMRRIDSMKELNQILAAFIREKFEGREEIRILEAGCGNRWPLDLGAVRFHLTGIDIDAEGLELRKEKEKDLDVAILDDLTTVELPAGQFDVIYSSYVLEHIDGAELAMENFVRWLKPGGYMLLKFPNRDSVFGFLTRSLPFRLHVLYKKYIYQMPHAGEPGHGPFPTVYDRVVSRRGMHAFCDRHKLEILDEYCTDFYLDPFGALKPVVKLGLKGIEIMSFGKLDSSHNNLVYVIRKPA